MKKCLFSVLLTVFVLSVFANSEIKGTDVTVLKSRVLLVEIQEVDEQGMGILASQLSKASSQSKKDRILKVIEDHKKKVTQFNESIKKATELVWNINKEVLYKTPKEIESLKRTNPEQYTVLKYYESDTQFSAMMYPSMDGVGAIRFIYMRLEAKLAGYGMLFRSRKIKDENDDVVRFFTPQNMTSYFQQIQIHLNEMEKKGNVKYSFKDYALDQAEKNCSKVKGITVYINEDFLHVSLKKDQSKLIFPNGTVKIVKNKEFEDIILNKKDQFVGIVLQSTQGAMRCIVNAKTGEILTVHGVRTGEYYTFEYRAKEFKKYGAKCK